MRQQHIARLGAIALLTSFLFLLLANLPQPTQAAAWTAKVDPWVLETAVAQPQTEFLVYLTEQADLSGAAAIRGKEAKGQYVYERLTAVAAQTQPALIQTLEAAGAGYQPFWIANMIWVRGDAALVANLAGRPDVARLYANPTVQTPLPAPAATTAALEAVEWGIAKVNAPAVWAAGFTGQGIVIGGQDTGYQWDHQALKNQYRGWDGSVADHNYNWHDAIHVGGSICGADSPVPCDDHNHGTHTMGTMVGDDGGVNQIGMAPGARWIGCRNMNNGDGTPATYAECYQWFIAPTDLNGDNPDPTKAPHVINNSWGCPASEGCTDPNVLVTVVNNVRAAGIVTVHSAGNSGSACGTVNTPAGIYDASFTVGATNSVDEIAGFSSRGPVTVDGSNRPKPDISAPGVSVRSSVRNGGYGTSSGTSMAGPHVAGLVALLLSARPDLIGDVDAIEAVMMTTAVPRTTVQTCGGVPGSQIPNNTYRWGRIDAWAAYQSILLPGPDPALQIEKRASASSVAPGEMLTYTLTVSQTISTAVAANLRLTDTLPVGVTFITATLPFTQSGEVVSWERDSLSGGEVWQVQLVVGVPAETMAVSVDNLDYGVRAEGITAVGGPAVTTPIASLFKFYLPLFLLDEVEVGPLR